MARFSGPMDFDTRAWNRSAEFELLFDCKPQRFYKYGETPVIFDGPGNLYNDTPYDALPMIRVYGVSGSLYVGNIIVKLKSIDGYVDIDCDSQNAFKGTKNCNGEIEAPGFPYLPEGKTGVTFEGSIDRVEIMPRWWTI